MHKEQVLKILANHAEESKKMARKYLRTHNLSPAQYEKGLETGIRIAIEYIEDMK